MFLWVQAYQFVKGGKQFEKQKNNRDYPYISRCLLDRMGDLGLCALFATC